MPNKTFPLDPWPAARHVLRGLAYGVLAITGLSAGMAMRPTVATGETWLAFTLVGLAAIFFSVSYAIVFHFDDQAALSSRRVLKRSQRDAIRWLALALPVFAGIAFVIFYAVVGQAPSLGSLSVIALPCGTLVGYAVFVLSNFVEQDAVPMRYQLIWPSLLAIGVTNYTGFYLGATEQRVLLQFPLLALIAYFIFSTLLPKGVFVLLSFGVLGVWFLGVSRQWLVTAPHPMAPFFASMLFASAVAAYVAVFEAWRITSHLALKTAATGRTIADTEPVIRRYYVSTVVALVLSFWLMPVVYLFTSLGGWFITAFSIQAAAALWLWLSFGYELRWLESRRWAPARWAMGELFVLFIALERFLPPLPGPLLDGDRRAAAFAVAGGGAALFAVRLALGVRKKPTLPATSRITAVFVVRANVLRALALLSSIMIVVLLWFHPPFGAPGLEKTNLVIVVYAIVIIGVFCVDVVGEALQTGGLMPFLFGLCTIARLPTSMLIGVIVAVGLIFRGEAPLRATLLALPFVLAAMGGFTLNDLADFKKDAINRPGRVLPTGTLSLLQAGRISVALLVLAAGTASLVAQSFLDLMLYLFCTVGVVLYSWLASRLGYLKGFLAALLSVTPIVFTARHGIWNHWDTLMLVAAFLYLIGRELLLDVRDVVGDRTEGFWTVPVRFGVQIGTSMGWTCQVVATALVIVAAVIEGNRAQMVAAMMMLVGVALSALVWQVDQKTKGRLALLIMWIPMLCGSALLIL